MHKPTVYLTFDDGPHPLWTGQVLELLQQYGAKATFFVLGKHAERHPRLIEAIIQQGHSIGMHSWNHRLLFHCDARTLEREIIGEFEFLKNKVGYVTRLVRPPWGMLDSKNKEQLRVWGVRTIGWDIDSYDYMLPFRMPLMLQLQRRIISDRVLLFHDGLFASPMPTRYHTLRMLQDVLKLGNTYRFSAMNPEC